MLALRNCGAVGRVSLNTRTIVRRQLVTETDGLVWNEFLRLRAQRRRAELIASIPLSIAGFLGSTAFLAFKEVDLSQAMLGIDPFIFYGAVTVGCGALGWLLGPFLGQAIWKVLHRRKASLIKQREKEFFQHIIRNRVDPSRQSVTNPVPDFYGEKIKSVKEYRTWLRDQRAYRKKAFGNQSGS